jgi:hypothetical protein
MSVHKNNFKIIINKLKKIFFKPKEKIGYVHRAAVQL